MPVEDNGFILLRTASHKAAFLQVSCTEWKNMFCLEIYGKNGKLQIDGLGGSYGLERLTHYRMLPQMGPPQTTAWEYPMGDDSWTLEFKEFLDDIHNRRQPAAGLHDARAALEIVETVYGLSGLL
jgi:predicted dehydrogenase